MLSSDQAAKSGRYGLDFRVESCIKEDTENLKLHPRHTESQVPLLQVRSCRNIARSIRT